MLFRSFGLKYIAALKKENAMIAIANDSINNGLPEAIFSCIKSKNEFVEPIPSDWKIVAGVTTTVVAKITGMTPAILIFKGRSER